jgi:hypothetical protein
LLQPEHVELMRKALRTVFGPGGAAEMLDIKPTTLASRIKRWDCECARRWPADQGVPS